MQSFLFHRYLLTFLLLSGFSVPGLCQTAGYSPAEGPLSRSIFDSTFEKALYKGTFDISKHHLSGLFFIKRTSSNSIRILFSSELGINFFDLELKGDQFIVHSCFPSLNKNSLLKLLENDFRLLLIPEKNIKRIKRVKSKDPEQMVYRITSSGGSYRYSYDKASGHILRIQTLRAFLGKTDLRVYGDGGLQPRKIHITNPTFRLHIRMTFLSN